MPNRRRRVLLTGVAASLAMLALPVRAQQWTPARPIKLILPYGSGGGTDQAVRVVSDKLAAALGQPVVIDTRPGASGVIGTDAGAKSSPDGYTLIAGSDIAFTILPHLQKVPYDARKDFEAVSLISTFPIVLLVNSASPIKSVKDLVALGQQKSLNFGSNGIGSSGHLAAEQLRAAAGGINFTHIPYKGQLQVISDLVGGQLDFALSSVGAVAALVKAGRLRALAVTSAERIATFPDLPTMAEAGFPGVDLLVWIGLFAPGKTPKDVVARFSGELTKILKMPDVQAALIAMEHTPASGTAAAMAERIRVDYDKWGKLIRDTNMKIE